MVEEPKDVTVSRADVVLLLEVVRARYMNLEPSESNAIVLAIEGLRWLVGNDSAVTRASLEHELAHWEQHSIVSVR